MRGGGLRYKTSSDFNWQKAGSLSESLNISTTQGWIQGRVLRGPAPHLFLDQNGPKKTIFLRPPPSIQSLDDRPPLSEGLDPPLQLVVAFTFKADPHIPVSSVTLVTHRRTNATVGR